MAFLRRHRRLYLVIVAIQAALLLAAILILSFGWTYLRRPLEQRLTQRFGRTVTIGSIQRIDHGFFNPVLRIGDVHVAQPGWVGGGDMIVVRDAIVTLPLLPLLVGQAQPSEATIDGLRIALVRRDTAHANWKDLPSGGGGGGTLAHLIIRNGVLTLDDRKRDHHFTAAITADDRHIRIAGRGALAGHPSTIALVGPSPVGHAPWPFRFDYHSAIASGTLVGRADHPLDLGHFDARATAWGDDLAHIDLLVEAGLPGTQPARLTANLRHDRSDWTIGKLDLHLGRSQFGGDLTVKKRDDRTRIDGTIVSSGLRFNDLASNAGLAKAAAKRRIIGPRLVPDTAIHLEHMQRTDATIRFDIRHFIADGPSVIQGARGTITLDHGVLTAKPLVIGLAQGRIAGLAEVRHQSGEPTLILDLRLTGGRLEAMLGDSASGGLAAHVRLQGRGQTVRSAIGTASGTIGVVGRDGSVNRRAALFLGADAGRALFADKADKAALRCLIAHFDVRSGHASATPFLLDTDVSRADGRGTIDLATERLALTLTGKPKLAHAVSLDLPIEIVGTLSAPKIVPPDVPKTVGTAIKLIGKAIGGNRAAPAPDADCAALSAQALS